MAFRLDGAKSIDAQLSRVVASEMRRATDEVAGRSLRAESIHEARKHVKKIRAVLHLLRKELGGAYAPLNDRMRSVGHQMSAVRDADALVEMMKMLRRRYRGVITASAGRAADAVFRSRLRQSCARLTGRRLSAMKRTLSRSRRTLRSAIRRAASGRTMRDGVERGYRRARRAMSEATAAQTEDARFHAWRRRIKDHWYQLRLVEGISRKVRGEIHERVRRLKRLQDWLGVDHTSSCCGARSSNSLIDSGPSKRSR